MQVAQRSKEVEMLTCQVQQREELLKEKAGIIITQLGDIMEVGLVWKLKLLHVTFNPLILSLYSLT